jgi:hypothetical protein
MSNQILWQERLLEHYGRIWYATTDENPDRRNAGEWTDGSGLEIPDPIREIAAALFYVGGRQAYFHGDEASVCLAQYILEHALMIYPDTPVRLRRMDPCECHRNVLKLWEKAPERYVIMTGWGLTGKDGYWRPHSWAVDDPQGVLVKTTSRRARYFGAPINGRAWQLLCGGMADDPTQR